MLGWSRGFGSWGIGLAKSYRLRSHVCFPLGCCMESSTRCQVFTFKLTHTICIVIFNQLFSILVYFVEWSFFLTAWLVIAVFCQGRLLNVLRVHPIPSIYVGHDTFSVCSQVETHFASCREVRCLFLLPYSTPSLT